VYGPASATDNALARFDGTTGKIIKDSAGLTYDGSNLILTSGGTWATSAGGLQLSMNGNDGFITTYYDTHTITLGAGVSAKNLIKVSGSGGSNNINFRVNSSDAMTLTSTGLGIGASSPAYKLDVQASGTFNVARFRGQGGSVSNYIYTDSAYWYYGDGIGFAGNGYTGRADINTLSMQTAGTERVFIGATGNVGIGTSSPSTKLTVYDATTPQLTFNNGTSTFIVGNNSGGNNKILYGTGAYPMIFYTNSTEAMQISASGNLGLGVTPSAWSGFTALQVTSGFAAWSSGVANARINANTYYNGGYKYIGTGTATMYEQDGYHAWYNAASGTAGNAITFTQAMTLTAGGNLLVGTTSPNARLTVSSGATTFAAEISSTGANTYTPTASTSLVNSTLQLVGGNASGATTGIRMSQSSSFELFFGGVQESGGAGAFVFQGYSGSAYAERMRISSAGNVGIGTNNPLEKLNVEGNLRLNGNVSLIFQNTGVAVGTISFRNSSSVQKCAIASYYNIAQEGALEFVGPTGSTNMVLDSSGNLLVGSANAAGRIYSYTTNNQWAAYAENGLGSGLNSGVLALVAAQNSANNSYKAIVYYNAGAGQDRFSVADSGAIATAGSISLGTTVAAISGIGVQFPATQSASSNANTLDDYEEGTWTPTIVAAGGSGSPTYSSNTGFYTKIGNTVVATAFIAFTKNTLSGGVLQSGGLPFAANATAIYPQAACYITAGSLITNPLCQVGAGSSASDILKSSVVTGAVGSVSIADLGSGSLELRYTVTYQV
jgi:hypothetical protein